MRIETENCILVSDVNDYVLTVKKEYNEKTQKRNLGKPSYFGRLDQACVQMFHEELKQKGDIDTISGLIKELKSIKQDIINKLEVHSEL